MKKETVSPQMSLKMIKYLIVDINYSGKIPRDEDIKLLNTLADDLFNPKITFAKSKKADLGHSHYGFPKLEDHENALPIYMKYIRDSMPDKDHE